MRNLAGSLTVKQLLGRPPRVFQIPASLGLNLGRQMTFIYFTNLWRHSADLKISLLLLSYMMETFVWELLCVIHVTRGGNYYELYIHVLKVRSLLLLKEKKGLLSL